MPPIELTYKYALLPPTMGADVVDQQMFEAHRYFNRLIELERERRITYSKLMSKYADVECLEAMLSALREDREAVRDEIKAYKAKTGQKRGTKEQSARAAELSVQIGEFFELLKAAKKAKQQDTMLAGELRELQVASEAANKAARDATPTFWGTYLSVESSAKQASAVTGLPDFKRWRGRGQVGVQLQGGLSVAEMESCQDPRLQLDMRLQPCSPPWTRKDGKPPRKTGKPRPRVRLRVLSEKVDGKRPGTKRLVPVYAEWPIIMHRPLPEEATITWVKVIRRPMPGKKRHRWTLHISVRLPTPEPSCADGAVAVDVGWRRLEDGSLRTAYVLGSDDVGHPVELNLRAHTDLTKADDLQSIRDKGIDELKEWLVPWLKEQRKETPVWLKEATKNLAKWRAPRHFHVLAHTIRESEDSFVDSIRERLEDWRKQDKHLYCYQAHQRDQAQAHRLDSYRKLARELSQRYKVLVLEDLNLAGMGRKEKTESQKEDKQNRTARRQARMAAPGELRSCLKHAFAKAGGIVAFVPPQYTSKRCHVCLVISPWDDPGELIHTCSACGATWDRDENACHNLLRIHRERSSAAWSGPPIKVVDYSEKKPRKEGSFQRAKRLKKEKMEALAERDKKAVN